ncbi:helix-turn-helix domain-containing protein [Streptomyces vinaceus]
MIETDPDHRTPPGTQHEHTALPATAADPAAALRVLVQRRQALLHQESAELASLSIYADRLAGLLPPDNTAPKGPPAGIELLTETEAVGTRLDTMLGAAQSEVLILDRTAKPPQATDRDCEWESEWEAGWDRVRDLLSRGVTVRTVTDRRGNQFPDWAQQLLTLTELGLQARIGPRLPTRLVLVDRHTCLLPPSRSDGGSPDGTALIFGDSLLHRAALPLFESLWARATPVGWPGGPLTAAQRELLGLLASGLKDESIARRLGVHVHTARKRISRMLEDLDADTRFQAGAQAAIRGWLHPTP